MKILKIGLLLFLTCIFVNAFAQENDFDLSKYKLPDLERRTLETNFHISGYNDFDKTRESDYSNYYSNYGNEYRKNNYQSDIFLNYNHYLNNIEFQRNTNVRLDFESNYYKIKRGKGYLSEEFEINPLFSFRQDNRKYYKGLSFFETNLALNYQYGNISGSYKNSETDYESHDNNQTHTVLAFVPLKLGIGRIEPIQDARHAIYIFDELSKAERMVGEKSDEQIIEFAKLISHLKNKRFFDSRIRRIAEIESVDSFLVSNNYINKQDVKYYAILSDIWAYGNGPNRQSGTRFSGAIRPGYYFFDSNHFFKYTYSGAYNLSTLLADGGIELQHEKPMNLYWQNSIDFKCYASIVEGRINDKTYSESYKLRIPNIQIGFYQTIGYYPNTRTRLSFGYSFQYIEMFDKTDFEKKIIGVEGKGLKATTKLSINYYISPKFRVNATSSFYYIWQDSKDFVNINFDNVASNMFLLSNVNSLTDMNMNDFIVKDMYHSFNIRLIYSIF